MPTGYTTSIKDGISFKDFIMQCARAMGACISMRDDPLDKPIPDKFEPSIWHKERIKETREALETLDKLLASELEWKGKQEYEKNEKQNRESIENMIDLRIKYKTMLIQVRDWQPPTSDHQDLKDFMIEQITGSIDFDCDTSYYEKKEITLLTGQQWLEKEKARLLRDLTYHGKEDMEELERVSGRNHWIKALRDSL
jgi:hypothetical protein